MAKQLCEPQLQVWGSLAYGSSQTCYSVVYRAAALIPTAPAQAQTEVDLALMLAVDISSSMDPDEQELDR